MKVKWRTVYGFIPIPIFQTDNMPDFAGGQSCGLYIKLRSKYWEDEGLIQHELCHCRQAIKYLVILYSYLYTYDKKFRMKMEVEGYKVQKKYEPNIYILAYRLSKYYDLDITQQEAEKLLS